MKKIKNTNKYQTPLLSANRYTDYTKQKPSLTIGGRTIAPSDRNTKNLEYNNVDKGISHQGRGSTMRLPLIGGELYRGGNRSQLTGNLNAQLSQFTTPSNDKYAKKFVDSDMAIMNENAPAHLQNVGNAYGAYQDMSAPRMTNVGTRIGGSLDFTTALGRNSLGRGSAFDVNADFGLNYSRGEDHGPFLAPSHAADNGFNSGGGATMGAVNSFAESGTDHGIGWGGDASLSLGLRNQKTGLSGNVKGSYGSVNTINPGLRVGANANVPLFNAGPGNVSLSGGAEYDFTSGTPRYNAGLNYTFKGKNRR